MVRIAQYFAGCFVRIGYTGAGFCAAFLLQDYVMAVLGILTFGLMAVGSEVFLALTEDWK